MPEGLFVCVSELRRTTRSVSLRSLYAKYVEDAERASTKYVSIEGCSLEESLGDHMVLPRHGSSRVSPRPEGIVRLKISENVCHRIRETAVPVWCTDFEMQRHQLVLVCRFLGHIGCQLRHLDSFLGSNVPWSPFLMRKGVN